MEINNVKVTIKTNADEEIKKSKRISKFIGKSKRTNSIA